MRVHLLPAGFVSVVGAGGFASVGAGTGSAGFVVSTFVTAFTAVFVVVRCVGFGAVSVFAGGVTAASTTGCGGGTSTGAGAGAATGAATGAGGVGAGIGAAGSAATSGWLLGVTEAAPRSDDLREPPKIITTTMPATAAAPMPKNASFVALGDDGVAGASTAPALPPSVVMRPTGAGVATIVAGIALLDTAGLVPLRRNTRAMRMAEAGADCEPNGAIADARSATSR